MCSTARSRDRAVAMQREERSKGHAAARRVEAWSWVPTEVWLPEERRVVRMAARQRGELRWDPTGELPEGRRCAGRMEGRQRGIRCRAQWLCRGLRAGESGGTLCNGGRGARELS